MRKIREKINNSSIGIADVNSGKSSQWSPSKRVLQLLEDHNSSTPSLGAERAIHYSEFYKKEASKYSSVVIRRAKSLAYHLRNRTIKIYNNEIIVGTHTEHRIGAICHVEFAGNFMLEDLKKFETRQTNPLYVDPKAKKTLTWKVFPYWLFQNVAAKSFSLVHGIKYILEQLNANFFIINEAGGIAHFLPNYEDVIQQGTNGLRKRIENTLSKEGLSQNNMDSLKANLVAVDAVENFADRYCELAESIGRKDLVEVLTNIPRNPAGNLREALQMIWFFQMIIQIESLDQGISLGRMDQYLYPLYLKEKEEGKFVEDKLKNLLCAFSLKLSEVIPLFSSRVTEMFGGLPNGQVVTIGGTNEYEEGAGNELLFMFLDVIDQFKTRQPNWHVRISKRSDRKFIQAVMRVIARGGGSPSLYNDDVIIPAMKKHGYPVDRVWNYATVGCVEPALPGESFTSSDAALFNLPIILELILGEGKRLNKKLPWEKGNKRKNRRKLKTIHNMEDLMEEVKVEMEYQIDYLKYCLDHVEKGNAKYCPTPFSSLTVKGCIESGVDLSKGGAIYNASGIQGVGLADIADSIAAIEELVFEKKEYTLKQIALACKNNFNKDDILRAKLLKVAKFGNDNSRVDQIANRLSQLFNDLISRNINTRGGKWMSGFYSMTTHRGMGKHTAALPSGRLRGKCFANGIAPTDGSDMLGPTASLNSVAKLDNELFGNGVNLNIKFDARTLKGEQGSATFGALVGGYFDQGGMQVQINALDPAVLLDAQNNPEKYRNLLVRISGYCAYFVDLTPEMQKEIIERTLQCA